jgi:diaminopimelate epimerase
MELHFSKMQALGNDFVVLDAVRQKIALNPQQIRYLADRHLGIGCDQVLIISPATVADADFNYQIFNTDGSEAEQCGNGARCVARFIAENQLSSKKQLTLQTLRGLITTELLGPNNAWDSIRVSLGAPEFTPANIPFLASKQQETYDITLSNGGIDQILTIGVVSVGNPHAVLQVSDIAQAPVASVGSALEHHALFPQRTNVEFIERVDAAHIRLRVWERGVGETQACGSGACAAVIIGRAWQLLDPIVEVSLPGGKLLVEYHGGNHPVYLTGSAIQVFSGYIESI